MLLCILATFQHSSIKIKEEKLFWTLRNKVDLLTESVASLNWSGWPRENIERCHGLHFDIILPQTSRFNNFQWIFPDLSGSFSCCIVSDKYHITADKTLSTNYLPPSIAGCRRRCSWKSFQTNQEKSISTLVNIDSEVLQESNNSLFNVQKHTIGDVFYVNVFEYYSFLYIKCWKII